MAFDFKPNKVKIDVGEYVHYIRGIPKVGKTTIFRDIVDVEFSGDLSRGLLLSLGQETGYTAIDGIYAEHIPNWESLVEMVDELVSNKKDNNFELIAFDTVDEFMQMATKETLAEHVRQKGGDVDKLSINSVLGGYGGGQRHRKRLVKDIIHELKMAGYGIFFIGHTLVKAIQEKGIEKEYQKLVSNLPQKEDEIFANMADLISTIYVDTKVSGGVATDSQRYIYFRDDNFVQAGSRFTKIAERVPYGAENYLNAFRDGVRNSIKKPLSGVEMEERAEQERLLRAEQASLYAKKQEMKSLVKQVHEKYTELGGKTNDELMVVMKTYESTGNPNNIKTVEELKKLLTEVKEIE